MHGTHSTVQNMHLHHGPSPPIFSVTSKRLANELPTTHEGEMNMKTIVSALVALSVLAGIASAPASAFDAKTFYAQQDRAHS